MSRFPYVNLWKIEGSFAQRGYIGVEDMRSLGWRFDIDKSRACQIVSDVCKAIVNMYLPNVIEWPTGEALKVVLNGFAKQWKFPQWAGAIDGTHIQVTAASDYPSN